MDRSRRNRKSFSKSKGYSSMLLSTDSISRSSGVVFSISSSGSSSGRLFGGLLGFVSGFASVSSSASVSPKPPSLSRLGLVLVRFWLGLVRLEELCKTSVREL